jgi:plasmid maintenance system antidote protein VapI
LSRAVHNGPCGNQTQRLHSSVHVLANRSQAPRPLPRLATNPQTPCPKPALVKPMVREIWTGPRPHFSSPAAELRFWEKYDTPYDDSQSFTTSRPVNERVRPGDSLRYARLEKVLTQLKLARLSGVPATAISAIEHGRVKLGLARAVKLARVLGVHPADLMGGSDAFNRAASPRRKRRRAA